MSKHNRERRRGHRQIPIEEQRAIAAERAEANAKRYPTAPTYVTHVSTCSADDAPSRPTLKPITYGGVRTGPTRYQWQQMRLGKIHPFFAGLRS